MWDDIEEPDQAADEDFYQGILLMVFVDEILPCNLKLMDRLERWFAAAPGGRDLRFAFAMREQHAEHLARFDVVDLPAAVFVIDGRVRDRADGSSEDVQDLAREVVRKHG